MALGTVLRPSAAVLPANRHSDKFTKRLPTFTAAAVLVMLLAMTIGTAVAVRSVMNAQSQSRFEEFVDRATASVASEVSRSLTELRSVEAFVRVNDDLNGNDFRSFAATIEGHGSAVQALGYIPLVSAADAGSFNALMAADGKRDFDLTANSVRSEYYPWAFSYPPTPEIVTPGQDLGQNAEYRTLLEEAQRTGTPIATRPAAIPGDPDGQAGFLVFSPIFRSTEPASNHGRTVLPGYGAAVYRVADFISGPAERSGLSDVEFRILEHSPTGLATEIYPVPGGNSANAWGEGFQVSRPLEVAGTRWEFQYQSPAEYGLSPIERNVWVIVLSAGMALTLFATASMYSLVASRQAVKTDLQLMTNRLRVVLDSALEAILLVDRDSRVVWANQSFSDAFGYGESRRLLGADWAMVRERPGVQIENRERYVDRIREMERNHEMAVAREDVRISSPIERILSMTSAPVTDDEGQYLGRLWVFRDVTAERAVEETKSVFVSMVSHELRTPLTSLTGFIDLVLDEAAGPVSDGVARYLLKARANGLRLSRLVSDILDISRLESGHLQIEAGDVDLGALLDELADSTDVEFRDRNVRLMVDLPGDLPSVRADRVRAAQVFENLLTNAYRYTPAGGAVYVTGQQTGRWVDVAVRDTGPGIAPEHQARVFDKFVRLEGQGRRPPGSTGLGLAITKALVELQGGSIRLESTLGKGSKFTVRLPAVEQRGV
ncbi:MAG: ATP-binding protein [Dehalococcoidia bacterium]